MDARRDPVIVLTDHGRPDRFVGCRRVVAPGLTSPFWRLPVLAKLRPLLRGLGTWWRIATHRGPAVAVTYGNSTGYVVAALQALFAPFRRPVVHVMFDFLMDAPRSGIGGLLDRAKASIFNRAVACAVIWGKQDVPLFARTHGLDRSRLRFHPYHKTLDILTAEDCDEGDDGYVYCGGNVGRDFRLFIEAIGPLGIPAFVATQMPGVAEMARQWPQITVRGVTPVEFRQIMARATIVAEVHPDSFFRSAGHQTMLNAMHFGKPVILSDERSAEGYVRHGIDGLVTPAGDREALTEAIRRLWEDEDLRRQMGERGRRKTAQPIYRTEIHMQSVYNVAILLHQKREGSSYEDARLRVYE